MAPCFHSPGYLLRIAVALACLGAATVAHATYTVIDDDLLPTALVDARQAPPTTAEQYSIPFARGATVLGPLGRRALDQLATSLQGATIKIIGRSDAMPGTNVLVGESKTPIPIAVARTNTLRQYLLRQGVPASAITTAPDSAPNPQPNGSIYPSYIVITRADRRLTPHDPVSYVQPRVALTPNLTTTTVATPPAPVIPAAPAAPSNTAGNGDRDRLIQFINQSVQSGAMDASVALTLMSRLLNNDPAGAVIKSPAPATAAQLSAPKAASPVPVITPTSLFIATPSLARKDPWVLNKALTLRDNVDAWSKQAGWNPSQWDASNYYQVTVSTTIEGDFPDVLRQVADSTGLNICAKKREKYVRVTDAGISCEK